MKNDLEIMGRTALFRAKESEPGTPSENGGVSVALDPGSAITSAETTEHDADTIHGSELPASIFSAGREASGALSQKAAKPDFMAFVLACFFGKCTSEAAGATGFMHTITSDPSPVLPTFTAVQKRGGGIMAERLSGNAVDSFAIEVGDGWVAASADIIGTGHRETNYTKETVTAPANAASITLDANGVHGADALERLANLYRVRAKDGGSDAWSVLSVATVSADVPAAITFAAPLGESADPVGYEVDYIPTEPAWCALPDFIDESPMRLVDAKVIVDGHFDGTSITGGEELRGALRSLVISGVNNAELRRFPGEGGPAAEVTRARREITISLTESMRTTVRARQADFPEIGRLSLMLVIRGAQMDPGSGKYFGAELVFPNCGILAAPVTTEGGRLAHAGDLVVMDDGTYGGALVRLFNKQAGYL